MTDQFRISHSKAKTGRRCQMAYYYKYVLKLRKLTKSRPLMLGSLVHECIESYVKTGHYASLIEDFRKKTFSKLNVDEQALNADIMDLTKMLIRGWVTRWERSPYKMLWVEKEFEVPLFKGAVFIGKIDGKCEDEETGRKWLIEHKTCKRMPDELIRMIDVQTPLYLSVLPQIDEEPVTGVIWDYVRTKPPAIPELLKSGQLSSRKNIDTLPEVFLREIKRHGLNPAGYKDTIESLTDDSFYRRINYNVSPQQIINLRQELIITTEYLMDLEDKGVFCRNLSRDCSWCDYRDLCYAELRGDDTSFMLKHDYEVKKHEEKIVEVEIDE